MGFFRVGNIFNFSSLIFYISPDSSLGIFPSLCLSLSLPWLKFSPFLFSFFFFFFFFFLFFLGVFEFFLKKKITAHTQDRKPIPTFKFQELTTRSSTPRFPPGISDPPLDNQSISSFFKPHNYSTNII